MQSRKSASVRGSVEQELAQSEARYRALVDSSPSAIIVDRNGEVCLANPACVRLFGASSPEELLGRAALDLFEPDSRPLVQKRLLVGSEAVPPVDVRVTRLDGTARDVEATAARFLDEGVPSIQVVLIDITERKLEREREAQRIAAFYSRSLIEASLDPLVTISDDGTITDVNEATEKATGIPRDRLVGTDFAGYFTDPDKARAGYKRVLKEGLVRDYPLRLKSVSGSVVDVEYNATAYRNEAGEVQGVFAAARDVTERNRAHEDAARLAAIVTSSEDAIFTKDLDEIVTNWNAGAESLYGYSAEEMIGKSVDVLMPPGRENEVGQLTERIRRGERAVTFETQRIRKDGSLFDASLTLSPIRNGAGDITAISVIQRDITERKRAEDESAARLRFVEGMNRINRAIQGTSDLDRMMDDVLHVVLSSLECDRAWLFYPCDPDSPTFRVPMEVARPEYPGAGILNEDVPLPPDMAQDLREALESAGPLTYLTGTERAINKVSAEQFGVQSMMMVALHPKPGKPWVFGVHQCSDPRVWTSEEKTLFEEIGWRLTDALTSLLSQRDVRETAEKFSAAFDASPDLVAITRISDGTILEVNEGYERLLGLTRAESLGKTTTELAIWADPADRARFVAALEEGGEVTDFETTLRCKDGTTAAVINSARTFDLQGEACILSVVHDITKRKRAEAELQDQLRFAQQLVEAIPGPIFYKDCDGRYLGCNAAFEDYIGMRRDEIIGRSAYDMSPKELADRYFAADKELFDHPGTQVYEANVRWADGSLRDVVFRKATFSRTDGSTGGLVGVILDITERKEAERARDIQGRMAYVFATSPEEAMYEEVLQIVLDATHSPLGLFGHLDENGDLVVPSLSREICDRCNIPGKSMRFPHRTWGDATWVRALRERSSIHSNEPSTIVPEGHLGIRRNLAMPILFQGEVTGLFEVANKETDYTEADIRALAAIAEHVAPLLDARLRRERTGEELAENATRLARQAERIARTLTSVVDVTSSIVELRDPYTAGHQRRVSELAGAMAESLGISGREIDDIRVAGLLHDIGKAGIPTEILSKPGVLSSTEFTLIKGHAEAGYRLAVAANMADPIAEMIYEHHERLDGSGYPRGLTGDQTLLGAKVLAVADVVEAMMSHRPYRPALGIEAAMAEIERGTGTLYDTPVAQACIRLFTEEGFKFPER